MRYRHLFSTKITVCFVALFIVAGLSVLVSRVSGTKSEAFQEEKAVHKTTAVVTGKVYVRYDEGNHVYQHYDGYLVERRAGDEEWRIYFRIESFDQLEDSQRSELMRLEMQRFLEGNVRYRIKDRAWYEGINVGDKITVLYRPWSDNTIEVVSVIRPT